ncbi:MAG TPA: urease accessory protein UreD [Verrucomicrobiae bacterium]|nr:urease accessory protein UreD [Verrucomicrobiae bacterium]
MKPRLENDAMPGPGRDHYLSDGRAGAPLLEADTTPAGSGVALLKVELVFNQSTVTGAYATSPMKLLTPRSRGQSVLTYVSNFGGGLVAGDQTRLELNVGRGARCFMGTQASTKIYRNPSSRPCDHVTRAAVGPEALLVFAPAPVQPFTDSSYQQSQQFHLAPGAGLVLVDWFTSGRTACGERWAFQRFATRNQVWQQQQEPGAAPGKAGSPKTSPVSSSTERCVFLDALVLDSTEGPLRAEFRTGRFNCFATLLVTGALVQRTAVGILSEVGSCPVMRRGSLLLSASPTTNGAVLRMASEELGSIENFLRRHLSPLAALLGDDPWSRRW